MIDDQLVRTTPHAQPPVPSPPAYAEPVPTHAPAAPARPKKPRNEGLRSVLSTIAILAIAPIVAIILTAFVFQSYQVDGPSMMTTLHNNDRLIVWKTPRTWARLTKHDYIPKRGDVIVFTEDKLAQFGQDPGKQLIKRVIALPGERVTVKDNALTVYNSEHPEGFQPDTTLPYGSAIDGTPVGEGEWTLDGSQLFVAGDNRRNSLDSRFFGPISASNIVGKLVIRVLPADQIKRF